MDGEAGGTEANGWLLRSLAKTAATDVLRTPVPLLRRTRPSSPGCSWRWNTFTSTSSASLLPGEDSQPGQVRTGEDSLLQVLEAAGSFRVAVMLLLLWQRSIPGQGMVVMVLRNQREV